MLAKIFYHMGSSIEKIRLVHHTFSNFETSWINAINSLIIEVNKYIFNNHFCKLFFNEGIMDYVMEIPIIPDWCIGI